MDRVDNRTGVFRVIDGELREIAVELADEELIAVLRGWTPEQRLQAAARHSRYMRRALRSQLESLHPEWSPERLQEEITRRYLGE
ncbi:MAG TPA: hypothetical protein VF092_14915 [Longimicrobium sp.]